MIHGDMVDGNRKLVSVWRGGITESVANLFKRGSDTLDDVNQGITWRKILSGALDIAGNIDMAGSAWVNKHLDNLPDGTTYGRALLARLSSGKPWIDFAEAIHANKHLGNISDDSGSNRHAASSNQLTGGDRGYTVIDSGYEVFLNDSGSNATKKVHLGTQSTPAAMQRIYRIPYSSFIAGNSTYTWDTRFGVLRPSTSATTMTFVSTLVLPNGATIIQAALRGYRNASGDLCQARLERVTDAGRTTLATLVHATTGWTTVTNSSLSETISYTTMCYVVEVDLNSTVSVSDAQLSYVEITVTVPDLNTGL